MGVRADEEGSRSKERYFSPRDRNNDWDVGDQPPELWNQFKTDFAPGTHLRIHPLPDWTELNIWEYIERENIPVTKLYLTRVTVSVTVRWAATPAPRLLNPPRKPSARSWKNYAPGNSPTSPSVPAAPRTKTVAGDWKDFGEMGTCEGPRPVGAGRNPEQAWRSEG